MFTDRFYTSPALATELYKKKCYHTGTIMPNRKGLPHQMKKPKLVIGGKLAFRKNKILVLAWRDKRIITMLSTKLRSTSRRVTRRARHSGDRREIKIPEVITNYNKNMGGVDVANQYATSYCFLRRTLKW